MVTWDGACVVTWEGACVVNCEGTWRRACGGACEGVWEGVVREPLRELVRGPREGAYEVTCEGAWGLVSWSLVVRPCEFEPMW